MKEKEKIIKFIDNNKDKMPLSYNEIVIKNNSNETIPNKTRLLKNKFLITIFYKSITRF